MPVTLTKGAEPIAGYTLVRPLGQGGFGQVWEAEAPGKMRVALKFIRTDSGHSGLELRAIEAMRDVRHPHLLEMHFCTNADPYLVIATSLCDMNLLDRFKQFTEMGKPGIPLDPLLRYMQEAAVAIDFLNEPRHPDEHGRTVGIQHRDIKPRNIFLVGDSVKVADFGLAKALEHTIASHTGGAMTPLYAAPEMFRNAISRTSDQYSLAATYLHLRTGKLPFTGRIHQIAYAHLSKERPKIDGLTSDELPIVSRALANNPAERWPSCTAFVAALTLATHRNSAHRTKAASNPSEETSPEANGSTNALRRITENDDVVTQPSTGDPMREEPTRPSNGVARTTPAVPTETVPASGAENQDADQTGDSFERSQVAIALLLVVALCRGVIILATRPEPPPTAGRPIPPYGIPRPFGPEQPVLIDLAAAFPKELEFAEGFHFSWRPPGSFTMGSPDGDDFAHESEKPQVDVRLTQGFWLGKTEVTQGQWRRVMDTEPWKGRRYVQEGDDFPAVYVSWEDAAEFCARLTQQQKHATGLPVGWQFALPTEAQWEYACRAGTTTRYSFGDDAGLLEEYAWYSDNSWAAEERYAHAVGRKQPNPWGFFHLHGNVWEWCSDWHQEDYYRQSPGVNPPGPSSPQRQRVVRGGGWLDAVRHCRSAHRRGMEPGERLHSVGFRVALVPIPAELLEPSSP